MYTRQRLAGDFNALGVEPGDILFVHSSFKSLGPVKGRARTVVAALEDAVGPEGLILMPSFHLIWRKPSQPAPPEIAADPWLSERYRLRQGRAELWDRETTPSTVGWLTEYFRLMPGTFRSDHYSHAVAARGKGAEAFVAGHLENEGLVSIWDYPPWGRTYGTHSPMYRACERDGKLLMLGTTYDTVTYIHLVEVIRWNRMLEEDPEAPYPGIDREILGAWWDRQDSLRRGRAGDSYCRLFPIGDFIEALVAEVDRDPDAYGNRGK